MVPFIHERRSTLRHRTLKLKPTSRDKTRYTLHVILVLLAGVWMGAASAAEITSEIKTKNSKPKAPPVDMLVEFTQKAVLQNPEVLMRWHNFLAAGSEKSAAISGYFPRLDLSVEAGKDNTQSPTSTYDNDTKSASLTLTQMLYDGFATRNEVRRLNNAQLTRYYELLDASETAALEAIRAYYDVLRQRKLFELTEDNYIRHRTAFEQIRLKVVAGVGRRVDLEQVSGRLALSEANLTLDNANVHDVSARFQRVVGVPPPGKLRSSSTQAKLSKQILENAAAALLAMAIDYHPAILAAIENVRSSRYDMYGRWGKYQPTINLVVSKSQSTNVSNIIGDTNNTTAKVTLNWNLFNSGADKARSNQYGSRLEAARAARDKACRDVRMTLAIAYNDIAKLKEQQHFLDEHQIAIEKARTAYQRQFDIGQRSLLDLLDTESELYQAKRSYVNSEYDLAIAEARTLAGMGKLVSALGISRLETEDLPELLGSSADAAENCPPEPASANTIDKPKLNERASEEAKAALEAARQRVIEENAIEMAKLESADKAFLMTPGEATSAQNNSALAASGVAAAAPEESAEVKAYRLKAEQEKAALEAEAAKAKAAQEKARLAIARAEKLRAMQAAKAAEEEARLQAQLEADRLALAAQQAAELEAARQRAEQARAAQEAARLKAIQEEEDRKLVNQLKSVISKVVDYLFF